MAYTPSDVGGPQGDRKGFDNIFWQRVCQKYRYLSRNTPTMDFVFDIADVTKDVNEEKGLGIDAYEESFIEKRLHGLEGQGFIEILSGKGQFRLTIDGIQYCKQLPETVG